MKRALILISLMALTSCASKSDFEYKDHCSKEAYSRVKKVHDLEKKKRRGEISKLEDEIMKRTRLLNKDYETSLKPLIFECLAEAERTGNKEIYSICTVAEVNLQGVLSFLEVEDQDNKLEEKLRSCITNRMKNFDYTRYPGVIAIQAINMDLDP